MLEILQHVFEGEIRFACPGVKHRQIVSVFGKASAYREIHECGYALIRLGRFQAQG